jgi:hypothetical protein
MFTACVTVRYVTRRPLEKVEVKKSGDLELFSESWLQSQAIGSNTFLCSLISDPGGMDLVAVPVELKPAETNPMVASADVSISFICGLLRLHLEDLR